MYTHTYIYEGGVVKHNKQKKTGVTRDYTERESGCVRRED